MQQNPQKIIEMVNRSRDTYRRASSYRIDGHPSTLFPEREGVKLVDVEAPGEVRVPIQGMEAAFRVVAARDRVTIMAIESSRGLPVITFDGWMKPTVTSEFRPFLVGDRVNVFGDFRLQLQRGNSAPRMPASYAPPSQAPAGYAPAGYEPPRYYPPAAPNQPVPVN